MLICCLCTTVYSIGKCGLVCFSVKQNAISACMHVCTAASCSQQQYFSKKMQLTPLLLSRRLPHMYSARQQSATDCQGLLEEHLSMHSELLCMRLSQCRQPAALCCSHVRNATLPSTTTAAELLAERQCY